MKAAIGRYVVAVGLLLCGMLAQAAVLPAGSYAMVDSVQMPAWVERFGKRVPLQPGQVLHNHDRVMTGEQGRVVIALAEGSAVKLGEQAQLDLNALGRRDGGVYTAALDVVRGAFRFTTGIFSGLGGKRAVNVRVVTLTAGIRGTDLWGSADGERDLVCLLEGRITVLHALDTPRELSEPGSFYVARKGEAPEAVGKVEAGQLAQWAAQTEVQPGTGYARRGGKWVVELVTVDNAADALSLYDRIRAAGYAVQIKPLAAAGGQYLYRLRITQLPNAAEAAALSKKLQTSFGLPGARVHRAASA